MDQRRGVYMVVDRRNNNKHNNADVGQALSLVIAVVVVITSLAWGIVTVAERSARWARAHTAADAAALAGVSAGVAGAARVATLNGAVLVECLLIENDSAVTVTVTVDVDGQQATARASNAP